MARKTTKICPVCGNEFKGTEGKITCSNACRTAASRMLSKGKKPEYWLMAKTKGQKMPLVFNGPVVKKKKPEKKEDLSTFIKYTPAIPDAFDSPPVSTAIIDEPGMAEIPTPLTWDQKWAYNDTIDKRIKEEREKPLPPGMHPRMFKLQQDDKISELEKQKLKLI